MNLNENFVRRTRGRGRRNPRTGHNVLNIYKRPEKASTNLDNSDTKWGNSRESIQNVSLSSVRKSTTSRNSTEESESRIIVALTEGRGDASCEVGIAAICVSKPLLILCQISDTQSYINTLSKINMFDPNEILVPNTFVNRFSGNRLVDKIKNHFPNIKLLPNPRSSFNKANGMDICSTICLPNMNGILLMLQHKYYALSAVSALVTYVQENFYTYYAPGTVKIEYQESEGYSIIDIATADHLELVCSANPQQSSKHSNLFGILNHCMTKIGKRTLRSCILQPPCDLAYMEERLDCVNELVDHPDILVSIQAILIKITDIDQLLSIGTIIPSDPQKCTNRQLNYMLVLNNFIELISPLIEILSNLERPFFVNLKQTLERDEFEKIKRIIRENIQESAHPAKGQNGIAQRCFAIKPDVNGLLDLVRKTYTERMNDMREYVKALAIEHDLPLTLSNNQTKGYHIVLSLNKNQRKATTKSDLPGEFIQVNRLAGSFTMKTPELMNLSTRLDDIMADILKLSNLIVHSFINEIKQYAHLFYILCEKIALLDVLQSLAETSVTNGYVRPQFGPYTEVIEARHPLLDFLLPVRPMPNSIYCSDDYNAHIITGPNGAGKSIFIRQVLLLQVMAQVGCYVPARSAVFRPADRMYARIYFGDYMECSASSFILELREINYIMSTMTKDSLIIIDELGRSTSLEEGTALAMAIVEKIAQSQAYLYITTHFILLTRLYDLYPNIKLWQLETVPSGDDPSTFELEYRFQLVPGVTSVRRYGIYMVRNIWSEEVMRYIDEILARITRKPKDPKTAGPCDSSRFKYHIESECRLLKQRKILTAAELNGVLETYYEHLRHLGYHLGAENVQVNLNESRDVFRLDAVSREAELELLDAGLEVFTPEPQPEEIIMEVLDDSICARTVTDFQDMLVPEVQLVEGEDILQYGSSPQVAGLFRPSPLTNEERNMLRRHENNLQVQNISILNASNFNMEDVESIREDLEVLSKEFSMDDDFGEGDSTTFLGEFVGKNPNGFSSENFGKIQHYGDYTDVAEEFSQRAQRESADFYPGASSPNNIIAMGQFGNVEIPQIGDDFNGVVETPWRQFETFPQTTGELDGFDTPQIGGNVFSTTLVPSSGGFETRTQFGAFTSTEFNELRTDESNAFHTIAPSFNSFATPTRHIQVIDQLQTPQKGSDDFSMVASPPSDVETRRNFQDLTISAKLETPRRGVDVFSVSTSSSPREQFKNSPNSSTKVEATQKNQLRAASTGFVELQKSLSPWGQFQNIQNTSTEVERTPKHQLRAAATQFTKLEASNQHPHLPIETSSSKARFQSKPVHIFPNVIILEGPNDTSISSDEEQPVPKKINTISDVKKINVISNVVIRAAEKETKTPTENYDDMCTDMALLQVKSTKCDDVLETDSENDEDKPTQDSDEINGSGIDEMKVESDHSNSESDSEGNDYQGNDIDEADTITDDNSKNTTLEAISGFQSSDEATNDDMQGSVHSRDISKSQKSPSIQKDGSITSSVGKPNQDQDERIKKNTTSISEASRLRNLEERISATSLASREKDSNRISDKQTKNTITTSEASKLRNLEETSSTNYSTGSNDENSKKSSNENQAKNTTSISEASKQRNLEKTSTNTPTSEKVSSKKISSPEKFDTTSLSDASKQRDLEKSSTTPTSGKASTSSASRKRRLDTDSSTSLKENVRSKAAKSSSSDSRKVKRKFVPPRRLTAREIKEDFQQQDRKLLETMSEVADMSRYYEQIINRPSVRQVQNATQLALIKKTQDGYQVIPTDGLRARRSRPRSTCTRFSQDFNLSIFSDQNARKFEEYAKSNEKNYNVFSFGNEDRTMTQPIQGVFMGVASRQSGGNSGMARSHAGVESFGMAGSFRSFGMGEGFGTAGASATRPGSVADFGRLSGMTGNPNNVEAFGMAGGAGMARYPSNVETFGMTGASGMARYPSNVETFGMTGDSGMARHPNPVDNFGMAGTSELYPSSFISSNVFRKNHQDSPFKLDTGLTPDGYYKQNKDDVNRIMSKYLGQISGTQKGNLFEEKDVNPDDFAL